MKPVGTAAESKRSTTWTKTSKPNESIQSVPGEGNIGRKINRDRVIFLPPHRDVSDVVVAYDCPHTREPFKSRFVGF